MVTIIVVCAGLMACVHLNRASIWYDEAITLLTTSGHAQLDWSLGLKQFQPTTHLRKILFDLYNQDVHPPLYFWGLALWRVAFGRSLEIARMLSALLILGSLPMLYWLARESAIRRAWVPVAVYATSAVGTWYAYDARPYAMATFLILLTQVLAKRKSRWTGVCGAAAFATHYFAALCIGPLLVWECLQRWRAARNWVLLTASSFVIGAAPLLLLLRVHIAARPDQYPGFKSFPKELWALLYGPVLGILPHTWLFGWKVALVVAAVFTIVGTRRSLRRGKRAVPILYVAFLCGFLILAVLTNKSIIEMPVAYYLGLAAPWTALLIGYGVDEFPRTSWLLAAVIVVGLIGERPIVRTVDYRTMVAHMRAECSTCPIVVGTGYVGAVPACVLYESQGTMQILLLNGDDSIEDVTRRVSGRKTVFFLPSNEPPTARIEDEFLRQHMVERKNGYFEVSLDRPPTLEQAESQIISFGAQHD